MEAVVSRFFYWDHLSIWDVAFLFLAAIFLYWWLYSDDDSED
jgi:hypothetical protein